jgi:signal transduction histidine kinase
VGTVALVANRVTARQFTLYVSQGGRMRSQRWALFAADYYQQAGSWEGVEAIFEDTPPTHQPGQGRGQGRGRQQGGITDPANDRYLIVDPDGWVVFDTANELAGQSVDVDDRGGGAPVLVNGQTVGTLWATTPDLSGHSELERRFLDAVNQAVLWAVLLVAVASLTAAALLSRQLIAPLRQLTVAAEAMSGGDLSQRVEVHSRDEVGELGQAFNQMSSDLQAAQAQRQQMTADIAHELRNPLSVIRGNLEAMLDGVYPLDAEHLAPIHEETMLLQRLVEDLRLLSLADAEQIRLIRSDVDVDRLLNGVAESAQAVAEDKGISLRVDLPEQRIVVDGDADRLRQVVGNLVSNALRHTPSGGSVTLFARGGDGPARIAVSDTGQGIPPEDLPHLFDRFYRGDAARDRASGGSGLGLAIARALVEAHGGRIEVESTVGEGTTFTVILG